MKREIGEIVFRRNRRSSQGRWGQRYDAEVIAYPPPSLTPLPPKKSSCHRERQIYELMGEIGGTGKK